MGRILLALWVWLAILAGAGAALAIQCDPDIAANGDPEPYLLRANDPRCEGMIVTPVSGEELELVSLTYGAPEAALAGLGSGGATLLVSVAPPADRSAGWSAHVRAMGIPLGLNYRMDAELAADNNYRLHWPLSVLRTEDLAPDQVGVLAFTEPPGGRPVYYPVHLAAGPAAEGRIVAIFRADAPISHVRWRYEAPGGTAAGWRDARRVAEDIAMVTLSPPPAQRGVLMVEWVATNDGGAHTMPFTVAP